TEVYGVAKEAQDNLRGAPDSLKQFNDVIRETGIRINDAGEIEIPEGVDTHMPVDTLRVHSSAIGDKLASGDLPGNVYQSLKIAKEGFEGMIESAAEAEGQGDIYRDLKRDWSRYMRDWKDMRAVGTGKGSVLARALVAPDTKFLRPLLTSKGGDQLLQTLGGYRDAGARPELSQSARKLARESLAIKAPAAKAMPPSYEATPPPKLREVTPPKRKPVPIPKPPSENVRAPRITRTIARTAGGVGGALLVPAHPFLGFRGGAEVAGELADRFYRNKSRTG